MIVHDLKLQQPFFDDVYNGIKDFEVRINDRDFKVGERVRLVEYPAENPRLILKDIKYILDNHQFGLKEGYVVLGLQDVNFNLPPSPKLIEVLSELKNTKSCPTHNILQ